MGVIKLEQIFLLTLHESQLKLVETVDFVDLILSDRFNSCFYLLEYLLNFAQLLVTLLTELLLILASLSESLAKFIVSLKQIYLCLFERARLLTTKLISVMLAPSVIASLRKGITLDFLSH